MAKATKMRHCCKYKKQMSEHHVQKVVNYAPSKYSLLENRYGISLNISLSVSAVLHQQYFCLHAFYINNYGQRAWLLNKFFYNFIYIWGG